MFLETTEYFKELEAVVQTPGLCVSVCVYIWFGGKSRRICLAGGPIPQLQEVGTWKAYVGPRVIPHLTSVSPEHRTYSPSILEELRG